MTEKTPSGEISALFQGKTTHTAYLCFPPLTQSCFLGCVTEIPHLSLPALP